MASSSRSNGSRKLPEAHYIRFTEEQNRDLHEVSRKKGQTIQHYLHTAAIAAIRKDLDDRHELEVRRREERERRKRERDFTFPAPRGLGLRNRDEPRPTVTPPEDIPPEAEPQITAPQVVIHNGPQAATTELDRLAAYVARGPAGERDVRLRTAVAVLQATAGSEEEKRALAKALDDKIAALGGTAPKAKSPLDFFTDWLK